MLKFALLAVSLALPAALSALPIYINQATEDGGPNFPANATWTVPDVGWIYRPTSTFSFSQLSTIFNSSDGRTVTVEIWTDLPDDIFPTPPPNIWSGLQGNATLLAATSFAAGAGSYNAGRALFLNGITFQAGQAYFIGYRNMNGMGANWTGFVAATEFLLNRFDLDGLGNFERKPPCTNGIPVACEPFDSAYVILKFDVPEPGTVGLAMAGLGLCLLLRGGRRRHTL